MVSVRPADVLTRRRDLVLAGDADGFADLFAPDAVIEMPFTGRPGAPLRLEGREAIHQYAQNMMASPMRIEEFDVTALHETQDPEVVVVEMSTKGTVAANGRPFSAVSVQILRIRDGRITLFRAFADPRAIPEVTEQA
ncbi:MAG: SnoaL-like domain-containing protein [Catenulispora sp.]|nr:SnoaL-like domain-containing protein [Catenulispora sp.]